MSSPWLSPVANAYNAVSPYVLTPGMGEEILGAAFLASLACAWKLIGDRRTRRLLRQIHHAAHLPEDVVRCQHIDFIPSGVINTATGREFIDMHVTAFGVLRFSQELPRDLAQYVQEHLRRALDISTTARPVLYDNMGFVRDANERDNVGHIISRAIKNGTAHILNAKDPGLVQHLGPRQRPIYATKLLILVGENCHNLKEMRLLSIDRDDLQNLPAAEDIRVDHNDGHGFQSLPGDPKLSRYAMMQGVADFVERMCAHDQIKYFQTPVPTGQVEHVPDPFAAPISSSRPDVRMTLTWQ